MRAALLALLVAGCSTTNITNISIGVPDADRTTEDAGKDGHERDATRDASRDAGRDARPDGASVIDASHVHDTSPDTGLEHDAEHVFEASVDTGKDAGQVDATHDAPREAACTPLEPSDTVCDGKPYNVPSGCGTGLPLADCQGYYRCTEEGSSSACPSFAPLSFDCVKELDGSAAPTPINCSLISFEVWCCPPP